MDLTAEQLDIVQHDLESHAKVLAVAGSGKTTTMVERTSYLVRACQVPPEAIRVVMFNKRIQEEFKHKLLEKNISGVHVQTFHSLGYGICSWAVKQQLLPTFRTIYDDIDVEKLIREAMNRAKDEGVLSYDFVASLQNNTAEHLENLRTSIAIWKGMMTPPERAVHLLHPDYMLIYDRYETIRRSRQLVTFDDMIFDAVSLLENNEVAQTELINRLDHIIVDEFQDVNYSKQRLAQLLAGRTAKVMVVGDDDQCIYEWTGANPAFIRRGFQETFTHFPHAVYPLSRSFRFGPAIAQTAANCIARNTDREDKVLLADDVHLASNVELHVADEGGMSKYPVTVIQELLEADVCPDDMIVLVRNYSQSFDLQGILLAQQIPFFVDGEKPFVDSFAVRILRHYLKVVASLETPLNRDTAESLREIINRPKRYVRRDPFSEALREAQRRGFTPRVFLRRLGELTHEIHRRSLGNVHELLRHLRQASASVRDPNVANSAHKVAERLLSRIDFRAIFTEFQSEGQVELNTQSLKSFCTLLKQCKTPLAGVEDFVRSFDPTRGMPRDQCIKITSIFKEKGREYDYVILPDVVDGQLPCQIANENQASDRDFPERWPARSSLIESERRLFYVALTRARKTAFVFSSTHGQKVSRFIHEAFIPETVGAANVLQEIVCTGAVNTSQREHLKQAATRSAELRNGIVDILRDVLQESPDLRAAETIVSDVNSVRPMPFRYPEAYPGDGRGDGARRPRGLPI